ncbi:MAG: hypothetical protein WAS36_05345 [Candidatus Saccharimonadales bacterium]
MVQPEQNIQSFTQFNNGIRRYSVRAVVETLVAVGAAMAVLAACATPSAEGSGTDAPASGAVPVATAGPNASPSQQPNTATPSPTASATESAGSSTEGDASETTDTEFKIPVETLVQLDIDRYTLLPRDDKYRVNLAEYKKSNDLGEYSFWLSYPMDPKMPNGAELYRSNPYYTPANLTDSAATIWRQITFANQFVQARTGDPESEPDTEDFRNNPPIDMDMARKLSQGAVFDLDDDDFEKKQSANNNMIKSIEGNDGKAWFTPELGLWTVREFADGAKPKTCKDKDGNTYPYYDLTTGEGENLFDVRAYYIKTKDEEGQKITMWVRANERANLLVVGQC